MTKKDRDDKNAFDRPGLVNGTVRLQQNLFRRFRRTEGKNCQEDQWYNHTLEMLAFPAELGGGPDDVEVARMHQVGAHGDVDFFHGEGDFARSGD